MAVCRTCARIGDGRDGPIIAQPHHLSRGVQQQRDRHRRRAFPLRQCGRGAAVTDPAEYFARARRRRASSGSKRAGFTNAEHIFQANVVRQGG